MEPCCTALATATLTGPKVISWARQLGQSKWVEDSEHDDAKMMAASPRSTFGVLENGSRGRTRQFRQNDGLCGSGCCHYRRCDFQEK